jgi:SHS family lactate transporter-like MFS transporter
VLGGTIGGYLSQIVGRRFSIIVLCVIGGALLYPYTRVSGPGIYASAFFEQFCVQGALGIIPIYLVELAPPAFNTFIVGTSYHLGIFIASASNTIETKIAEHYPLEPTGYDYGKAICIFTGAVFAYTIIVTILGPENRRPQQAGSASDNSDLEDGSEYDRELWRVRRLYAKS